MCIHRVPPRVSLESTPKQFNHAKQDSLRHHVLHWLKTHDLCLANTFVKPRVKHMREKGKQLYLATYGATTMPNASHPPSLSTNPSPTSRKYQWSQIDFVALPHSALSCLAQVTYDWRYHKEKRTVKPDHARVACKTRFETRVMPQPRVSGKRDFSAIDDEEVQAEVEVILQSYQEATDEETDAATAYASYKECAQAMLNALPSLPV